MGQYIIQGTDAPQNRPDTSDFVPSPKPPVLGRAADGNDSGPFWDDHDDPGQQGAVGEAGDSGVDGQPGAPGTPIAQGTSIVINRQIDGIYQVLISAGLGQPGGHAGRGGDGGRGQDGGLGPDEVLAGDGGRGGRGGNGGRGGAGGAGGDIGQIDILVGPGIDTQQVLITNSRGYGAPGGRGGEPGIGGAGGVSGNGAPAMQGDSGINPGFGPIGNTGIVSKPRIIA